MTNSYALFTNEVTGTKTITAEASLNYEKIFNYTGESQTYTVPKSGYSYIEMAGASGGTISETYPGKPGTKTSGYINLKAGEKLYFYVGGSGSASEIGKSVEGGYNGGGIAAGYTGIKTTSGGGATDVRLTNGNWDDTNSLISRIMVAAGGAGGNGTSTAYNLLLGNAGGLNGLNGYTTSTNYNTNTYPSNGGTQISGGTGYDGRSGAFGKAYTGSLTGYGSGGGGGYYGGAMGYGRAGGGGSSYISGYAGVNSVKESTTITHTNQTLHYSGKYFIGATMTDETEEGNTGNGYAKITYVKNKPERKNQNLNNVRYIKDCINYNTSNNGNHWIEVEAIKDGENIAKGKTVTGTTSQNSTYPYTKVTDGDITYSNYGTPSSYTNNQCITVDLGQNYDIDEVAVWNYFGDQRSYYDSITSVSSDNQTFTKIIDESTTQTSNGRRTNAYIDNNNGYISNNLMLWYDGFSNTGTTRNITTSTWKNLANSNLNGTLKNSPTWYNNYLSFNGTNNWVSIAQMNYSNPTVEVVYKKSSYTNAEEVLVGNFNDGGYGIRVANQKIGSHIYIGNKWYDTVKDSSLNKIEVISATYDNNQIKLYSNGNLVSTTDITENITTATNNTLMALGVNPYGTSYDANSFYKGNIYSVRIYNKALTQEEITHNYNYDKQKFNIE